MPPVQFGFGMPADQLDKARRATDVTGPNRALGRAAGHFDAAWMIDHLQFGAGDVLEGFTGRTYMAARHPQLKFGHTVLCHSFHNPPLLATMSATLQFLSGGVARAVPCARRHSAAGRAAVADSPLPAGEGQGVRASASARRVSVVT